MKMMHEAVQLPEPGVKQFLHPVDVPQARALYLRGWWFGRLRSVPVAVALGAVVWMLTGTLFAALVSPAVTFAIAFFAHRWFTARAWDYIPRKRQSSGGATSLRLLAAVIDALALVTAAAAITIEAADQRVPTGVLAFALGSAAAVVILQVIEIVVLLVRHRGRLEVLPRVVLLAGVISAVVVAVLIGGSAEGDPARLLSAMFGSGMPALFGAVTIMLGRLLAWILAASGRRRAANQDDE